jgi:hypothetical protein
MIGTASLAVLLLAACGEDGKEPSLVSEAVASPATAVPDYGWRTDISPSAVQDGAVKDYD